MGLATVDPRRGSDVSPTKAPSGGSSVFPLPVSTRSPSSCKTILTTLESGRLCIAQFHLRSNVRSPACLFDVPY
jgi:hypothetical protein